MADNITITPGSGETVAFDEIGGTYKIQRVKIVAGGDGVNDGDIASGNPLPVDIISALPAGTAAIGKLAANSGVDIGDVDVTSVPAPLSTTGGGTEATALRVTLASDSTGVLSVDDNGGALTVDNGGTFAVQEDGSALTALQLIDDIVHVDDTATHATGSSKGALIMAAATPTDGAVDANDIGAVAMSLDRRLLVDAQIVGTDVALDMSGATVTVTGTITADAGTDLNTSALALESGGNLATLAGAIYTEDAAAAANPVGFTPVLVRQDTPAGLVTTDGDVVAQRATNYGAAFVQVLDSSGNFIDTFGGSGGTASTDDGAFTAGSGQGTPAMGFFSADTVDAGDVGVLAMDASRRLLVSIEVDNVGIGGGTQYAVDAALGATPTGTLGLAIRDDALSALTPVEGDAIGLRVDANGALWVIPSGTVNVASASALDCSGATVTVDNGGTFAVQEDGAALTALQLIDDPIATDDTTTHTAATTKVMGIGAVAVPTDTAVDANDIAMPGMSLDRRLWADAQIVGQDADLNIADGGNKITVDWNGTDPPIGAGTEAAALRVTIATDSTGVLSIDDGGGTLTVDTAGGAIDVDLGANNDVQGATAHDAAVSGNPFLLAGEARTTTPTAVADGDVVRLQADDQGRLIVEPHAPRDLVVHQQTTITSSTAETTILTAAASTFHDLTSLILSNSSATLCTVTIKDATTGTTRLVVSLAADGGGAVINFPTPLTQAAVNNNWTATCSASVASVAITAVAVKRA